MSGTRYLLTDEVARRLRRSRRTIYRWISLGILTPKKVVGGFLIPQIQIRNLLKEDPNLICHRMPSYDTTRGVKIDKA